MRRPTHTPTAVWAMKLLEFGRIFGARFFDSMCVFPVSNQSRLAKLPADSDPVAREMIHKITGQKDQKGGHDWVNCNTGTTSTVRRAQAKCNNREPLRFGSRGWPFADRSAQESGVGGLRQIQVNLLRSGIQPRDPKTADLSWTDTVGFGWTSRGTALPACLQHGTQQ